jgi:hypothetical protein
VKRVICVAGRWQIGWNPLTRAFLAVLALTWAGNPPIVGSSSNLRARERRKATGLSGATEVVFASFFLFAVLDINRAKREIHGAGNEGFGKDATDGIRVGSGRRPGPRLRIAGHFEKNQGLYCPSFPGDHGYGCGK